MGEWETEFRNSNFKRVLELISTIKKKLEMRNQIILNNILSRRLSYIFFLYVIKKSVRYLDCIGNGPLL